jgi:hypothetical protein
MMSMVDNSVTKRPRVAPSTTTTTRVKVQRKMTEGGSGKSAVNYSRRRRM